MDENERLIAGMKVRREVLGDDHVDEAQRSRDPFTGDFQDLLTRYAWGEVWARTGLPRSTRSMLTIALLVALNRPDELRMHLRAAFRTGVSADEIREVLLQCALYCGLPAANAAFHIAQEVRKEMRD